MRAAAGRRLCAGLRSAGRSVACATEPSGPNSVLGLPRRTRRGSTPAKQEVLTTNLTRRPTGQCSTFRRLIRFQRIRRKSSAWTDLGDPPNGSLERR